MGGRVLVAGGAGFIGSAFVRRLLAAEPATEVLTFDLLTYAGHRENLDDLADPGRHRLRIGDVADPAALAGAFADFRPTAVVNLAAESHVDQSLFAPARFVRTNVLGTQALLDACREADVRYVHVSTDEVYGPIPAPRAAGPDAALAPTSPYAASKAAGDLLVQAAWRSHGQDAVTTRCTNNYGPRQLPEKLVPLMTLRALAGEPLPLYGDGRHERDWIHVDDHVAGLHAALRRGRAGAVYHFAGEGPRANRDVVWAILSETGSRSEVRLVADRPGHDRRYALDDAATRRELAWAPTVPFAAGLAATVAWYRDHPAWCAAVTGPELRAFLAAQYGTQDAGRPA
jgi:dTDP-glucose 4,6-dehydratase